LRLFQKGLISGERGFHAVARSQQARAMDFSLGRVGLEKAIPDAGARQVKVGADLFQQLGARQKALPDEEKQSAVPDCRR